MAHATELYRFQKPGNALPKIGKRLARKIALVTGTVVVVALAGCGGSNNGNGSTPPTNPGGASSPSSPSSPVSLHCAP